VQSVLSARHIQRVEARAGVGTLTGLERPSLLQIDLTRLNAVQHHQNENDDQGSPESSSRIKHSVAATGWAIACRSPRACPVPRHSEMMLIFGRQRLLGKRSPPGLHPAPFAPPYSHCCAKRSSQNRSGTSDNHELATIYEPLMAISAVAERNQNR